MTALPTSTGKKLGLVIDLDICVGCHACAVNCKEWNTGGHSAPLPDSDPYGSDPSGVWFNRIHSFEVVSDEGDSRTVHFPKSCLHCEDAPCVTVCPTGASHKRAEDGIVLVNPDGDNDSFLRESVRSLVWGLFQETPREDLAYDAVPADVDGERASVRVTMTDAEGSQSRRTVYLRRTDGGWKVSGRSLDDIESYVITRLEERF